MTSQNPSTPVKVPPSAANYTPATLDLDLRSQINMALIKEGCVTKIQEQLLHSLHAHHSNWPTVVQTHAITLLRSGEVSTFPALLRRVMEDVRQDTALAPGVMTNGALEVNGGRSKSSANGGGTPSAAGRGDGENGGGGSSNGNSGTATLSLAVPHSVVEDALKVTRDSLEMGSSNAAAMKRRRIRGEESEDEGKEENRRNSLRNCVVTTGTDDRQGDKMDMETNEGVAGEESAVTDSFTLVEALRTAGLYDEAG